ncbi:MAG: hypothetical protein ACLSH8_14215 [Zhenhengia sp.]|nr:hypothetical protein [Clostridiales bacterium]MDU6974347.1 hypothetical protein [Clostridiales bacterium]
MILAWMMVLRGFRSSLTPCVITPTQGEHYKYLIATVRMSLTHD